MIDCGTPRQLLLPRASEITPRSPRWIWADRVPEGHVSVLAGPTGLGKSSLACLLAAQMTRGTLPGDLEGRSLEVAIASAEDDASTTGTPGRGAEMKGLRIPGAPIAAKVVGGPIGAAERTRSAAACSVRPGEPRRTRPGRDPLGYRRNGSPVWNTEVVSRSLSPFSITAGGRPQTFPSPCQPRSRSLTDRGGLSIWRKSNCVVGDADAGRRNRTRRHVGVQLRTRPRPGRDSVRVRPSVRLGRVRCAGPRCNTLASGQRPGR